MAWQDRLSPAAYTSPSGARFEFTYEDVSRAIDKRTTVFDFPNIQGSLIQDFGRSGRQYPLRVIFSGGDHDITADQFFIALGESGAGLLEHPRYGTVTAIPTGRIRQRDDLKTAANQTVIELAFFETLGVTLLAPNRDPRGGVFEAVDQFLDAMAENFASILNAGSDSDRANLSGLFRRTLEATGDTLAPIAAATTEIESRFNDVYDSINGGIDQLISDPLTIGSQVVRLVQLPGRAAASIQRRLDGYETLARSLITGPAANSPGEAATRDLYASSEVTGAVVSTVFQAGTSNSAAEDTAVAADIENATTFQTRPQAIDAADQLLTLFEDVAQWRDEQYAAQDVVDTGEAYQQMYEAVSLAAGFIVELSFTLRQERRLVLDRPRTFVDLVGELYGELDPQFDFFINSNALTGSEILEIPEGREVVYYV